VPFITVEVLKGKTLDQRREFARRVTAAAVEALDTPADKVRIVFRELDPSDLSRAGILASDAEPAPIVSA
jgi:4-oxalocrotonate tautomerase